MSKVKSFRSFSNRFHLEWQAITSCMTINELAELASGRLVKFFQNDPATKGLIESWNKQLSAKYNLRHRGFEELSYVIGQIREHPKSSQNILNRLEEVLEGVRGEGCCVNLDGFPDFMEAAYYELKRLYLSLIPQKIKLTFAPSAYKCTCEWAINCEVGERAVISPPSFWEELLKLGEYLASSDDLTPGMWSRVHGDGKELWVKADHARNQAFARILGTKIDGHNLSNSHLFKLIIEMYTKIRALIFPECSHLKTKIDFRVVGKLKVREFVAQYWVQNQGAKHGKIVEEIRANVALEKHYKDTTLKGWFKDLDPRKKKPRGPSTKQKFEKKG